MKALETASALVRRVGASLGGIGGWIGAGVLLVALFGWLLAVLPEAVLPVLAAAALGAAGLAVRRGAGPAAAAAVAALALAAAALQLVLFAGGPAPAVALLEPLAIGAAAAGAALFAALAWPRLSPAGRTAVAALAVAGGAAALAVSATGTRPAEARIYVEPPQVYTRERLVNDRYREMNWLERRLSLSENGTDRPNARLARGATTAASLAGAGGGEGGETPGGGPASGDGLALPRISDFNREIALRSAVRSEMMNTLLDDGHDLFGSTLYRLNFDVSIVPRPGADGFALVAVDILPPDERLPPCRRADTRTDEAYRACMAAEIDRLEERLTNYRSLLADWEIDLQEFLLKVFQNRLDILGRPLADPFRGYPKERMAFSWYVRARAMELWLGLVAGRDEEGCDDAASGGQGADGPAGWACDAGMRRAALRRMIGGPFSDEALSGDLSPTAERMFAEAIAAFGEDTRELAMKGEIDRFFDQLRAATGERQVDEAWLIETAATHRLEIVPDDTACIRSRRWLPGCAALYGRLLSSPGCAARAVRVGAAAEPVACPARPEEGFAPVLGMVRLAGILRSLHERLVDGRLGDFPPLPEDEAAAREQLGARSEGILACLFDRGNGGMTAHRLWEWEAANADPAAEACAALPGLAGEEARRFARALGAEAAEQRRDGTSLFRQWLAEFYVDRLRREDIPGYRPQPAVDRFFEAAAAGCEVGDCSILIARKRWLARDDLPVVDEALGIRTPRPARAPAHAPGAPPPAPPSAPGEARADPAPDARGGFDIEEERVARLLLAMLPATAACADDDVTRPACREMLAEAALAVEAAHAAAITPERPVIYGEEEVANARLFERAFARTFEARLGRAPGPGERRRAWSLVQDYVDSVTALVLGQKLEAFDGEVVVYSVEPRIEFLVDDVAETLAASLRLEVPIGGGGEEGAADGGARPSLSHGAQSSVRQLARRPTIVGFGHLRGQARTPDAAADAGGGDGAQSFGWIFLPNHLEAPRPGRPPVATHRAVGHRVSAVISVPSWWAGVDLVVRQCWGWRGAVAHAVLKDPYATVEQCPGDRPNAGFAPAGRVRYTVPLPADTERITEVFDFEVVKIPYLDKMERHEIPRLEAGRAGTILLTGGRLWRGTMVTLGQQAADSITVLPDMKGVVAHFGCVAPPPDVRHVTRYEKLEKIGEATFDPADAYVANAKLTVWTAQGSASAGAFVVPFKQRLPDELPCWLDEPARERARARLAAENGDGSD